MMKLAAAAAFFDRTPVTGADTPNLLFYGQLDPFDDSRRDAGSAYRRILSVKPGTAMPANASVKILGQVWLVGAREADGLAVTHREKYVLQRADRKLSIYRLPGYLAGTPAAAAWANVDWLKDVKEIESDSRTPPQCTVTLPLGTDVRERDVVADAAGALLVLQVHNSAAGFTTAIALQLDAGSLATASIAPRTYAPGTGFVDGTAYTTPALRVRWQSLFEYQSQADERFQEGDCSLALPANLTVTGRDRITFAGVVWSIVSSSLLAGALVAHVRRA